MSAQEIEQQAERPPLLDLQWGKLQNIFWRLLPILMLLAAFLPNIAANLGNISQSETLNSEFSFADGAFIQNISKLLFGKIGPILLSFLPASLICYGMWKCSRALGAKIWGASIICALYVAASVFKIIPNFQNSLDDGFFAAFILLSATFMLGAIEKRSQVKMALAFLFSVFAVLLRPYAAWPQFAVFLAIILSTKHFEERPLYGLISALCWGPGLFLAHKFSQFYESDFDFNGSKPIVSTLLQKQQNLDLGNFEDIKSKVIEIVYFLISALPFAILGALTIIAIIALLNHKRNKGNAKIIGFSVFLIIAVLGAIGYGQINSARLLLDGLFLCAIGAISGANVDFGIINWLKRFRLRQVPKT